MRVSNLGGDGVQVDGWRQLESAHELAKLALHAQEVGVGVVHHVLQHALPQDRQHVVFGVDSRMKQE